MIIIFFSSQELLFDQNSIDNHLTLKVILLIGLNNVNVDRSIEINVPWIAAMSIMWSPVEDIIHAWFWRVSISAVGQLQEVCVLCLFIL